jgi:hypothetical protein
LGGFGRTARDLIAAGKLIKHPTNSLVDDWGHLRAVITEERGLRRSQDWTLGDGSPNGVVVDARLDGALENRHIPTVEKVAVKPVSSRVALGKDKLATLALVDVVDSVNDLEEQVREHARV